jgi:hypothetical protein
MHLANLNRAPNSNKRTPTVAVDVAITPNIGHVVVDVLVGVSAMIEDEDVVDVVVSIVVVVAACVAVVVVSVVIAGL